MVYLDKIKFLGGGSVNCFGVKLISLFKMARTMTTSRKIRLGTGRKSKKTQLDRLGRRILSTSQRDSLGDVRKISYSPRADIVHSWLDYVRRAKTNFKGVVSPGVSEKTYKSEDDVMDDFKFAELTFVGFRGYFGMMQLRDEFPAGFFVLRATRFGPKLVLGNESECTFLRDFRGSELAQSVLEVCA